MSDMSDKKLKKTMEDAAIIIATIFDVLFFLFIFYLITLKY